MLVWAPVPVQSALTVSKVECGPSLTLKSWDLPNLDVNTGLDTLLILNGIYKSGRSRKY